MLPVVDDTLILQRYYRRFIDGSHILHLNCVLDAFGHLSFRHPLRSDVFIMSHSIAPATISSPMDLIAYRVDDAEPVTPTANKGYEERRIHSEIYKRHKNVQAIVHSHSEAVVPYSISGVRLKPCYHMAGFLGADGAAVFDIAKHRDHNQAGDMLVRTEKSGRALAETFDEGNCVTLMRGHGFTVVAESVELAVMWATFTHKNAVIENSARILHLAHHEDDSRKDLSYLSKEECLSSKEMTKRSVQRPWQLWVREVEASGLYVNTA